MITLIDNYDSFTYNLVQYLGDLGAQVQVYRNDRISVEEVFSAKPEGILISPGPSDPDHAGICLDLTRQAAERQVPLFGVCLGLQTIGQAFGGKVVRAPSPCMARFRIFFTSKKAFLKGCRLLFRRRATIP